MTQSHEIKQESFGQLSGGAAAKLYTLTAGGHCIVKLTDYGATVVSISTPDSLGEMADITLGYDNVAGYEADTCFIGTTAGRYANRIAGGAFEIDGKVFRLARNNGTNHLHGGLRGFNRYIWKSVPFKGDNSVGVCFRHYSPEGDEGYPGNLEVGLTITLFSDDRLTFDFVATTDKATVINLTNHSYFNLAGQGDILDHEVKINADAYLPVDESSIPLKGQQAVDGTVFDFRKSAVLATRMSAADEQLKLCKGFDHNFILSHNRRELTEVVTVSHKASGRLLTLSTTEPGVQFYTGNFLNESVGRDGRIHSPNVGLCLEPQFYPDSPNRPDFPSALLVAEEEYRHVSEFRFATSRQTD